MKNPVVRSRSGRSCRQRGSSGEASAGRARAEVLERERRHLARAAAASSAATRSSFSRREIVQVE